MILAKLSKHLTPNFLSQHKIVRKVWEMMNATLIKLGKARVERYKRRDGVIELLGHFIYNQEIQLDSFKRIQQDSFTINS